MSGREVNLPLDLLVSRNELSKEEYVTPEAYASEICGRMHKAFEMARNNIKCEQKRQKRLYVAKIKGKPYALGDKVWLYCPRRKVGLSPKLQSFWKRPYEVKKCISDAVYRIESVKTHCRSVVHFDILKPCHLSTSEQDSETNIDNTLEDSTPRGTSTRRPPKLWRDMTPLTAQGVPYDPDPPVDASFTSEIGSVQDDGAETHNENETGVRINTTTDQSPDLPPRANSNTQSDGVDDALYDSEDNWTGRPIHQRRQRQSPLWMRTGDCVI